jgi:hypothetical protein
MAAEIAVATTQAAACRVTMAVVEALVTAAAMPVATGMTAVMVATAAKVAAAAMVGVAVPEAVVNTAEPGAGLPGGGPARLPRTMPMSVTSDQGSW